MANELKNFAQGGTTLDPSPEFVEKNDDIGAWNVRSTGTSSGEAGYKTDIESNNIIAGVRSAGINKAIGAVGFEQTRKAYGFVYNSQNKHRLVEIDYDLETETTIFENITDTGGINVLPLNPQYYINDIKLLNSTFLIFTDNNMEPCYINLERLKSGGYGTLTESDWQLVKAQPIKLATAVYGDDAGRSVNLMAGKLFQYAYSYTYLDNELSVMSSYSKRLVPENEPSPVSGTDVTKNNNQTVSVNAGTNRVKILNINARYSNYDWFTIKSIARADMLLLPTAVNIAQEIYEAYDPATNIYSFVFYNDGLYQNLDVLYTDLPYDYVPLKAGSLELINGAILALADLTEGYARPVIDVKLSVAAYDPHIDTTPVSPGTQFRITRFQNERINNTHKRNITIFFDGIPKEGDKFVLQEVSVLDATDTLDYSYTVPPSQDGNLTAVLASIAALIPGAAAENGVIYIRTASYYELSFTYITLLNPGTGTSKSIRSVKTNTSYEMALAFYDRTGRYMPLVSGTKFVVKTKSFAQYNGLIPKILWQINTPTAPVGAVSYQWLMSYNNTHQTDLYINGKMDTDLTGGDYITFNINSLYKFNQTNSSSILNYEWSPGDRVTFQWIENTPGVKTYFNTPAIDVEVVGFKIVVDTVPEPDVTNYFLKVRKPSAVNTVDLAGKNVMLEIYSPKKRATAVDGVDVYAETLYFEVGERFDVVNGQLSVLTGEIKEADAFFKTRELINPVSLNLDKYLVEDFNFSDFYISNFYSYGRPRTYNDQQGQVHRIASIRYSDISLIGTKDNGITRFYGERIYGDNAGESSSDNGSIGKISQVDNSLVCIQAYKVGFIPVNISIIEDQIEQQNVAISDKLLNFIRYSTSGDYGIGNAKESFAKRPDGTIYFIDPNNSLPVRVGNDGVRPIPAKNVKYFRATLQLARKQGKRIIGWYDVFNDEYYIGTEQLGDIVILASFNVSNWRFLESYVIAPANITISTAPSHGSVVYDSGTGLAVYTPSPGYTGTDFFIETFLVDGVPTFKKSCITVTPGTTTIVPFYFKDVQNATINTVYESQEILITGNDVPVAVTILPGFQYSINEGPYTSAAGVANNGDLIKVKLTSSSSYDTTVSAPLTVSAYTDSFDVKTNAGSSPTPFTFVDVTGADVSTLYVSNMVTIAGLGVSVAVTITGGQYSKNGGAYTSAAGTATNGDNFKVRNTSSASYLTTVNTTLTVGTYSDTYSITTKAEENFGNAKLTTTLQRNNCSAGSTGTYASYIIPANTYFGPTQVDADNQATADAAANAQNRINQTSMAGGGYTDPEDGGVCLLDTVKSILVVDMFTDTLLDVCAYIDTSGVTESGNIVSAIGAQNFYLTTETPATAFNSYMLSSDAVSVPPLTRRFEFNIGKLIALYPDDVAVPTFVFKIRGRTQGSAGSRSGVYQLKFPTQQMTMTGSAGSYIPSITPAGGPASIAWSASVIGGGNGTVGVSVGDVILTFTYTRSTNTIVQT